jgi:hypothetical protein
MLMPLLRVNDVPPLMATGADGLLMMMAFQVTSLPSVFVQLAGVATVESQMALSFVLGAMPLTQLAPNSKLLLLFALIWSARAIDIDIIATLRTNASRGA